MIRLLARAFFGPTVGDRVAAEKDKSEASRRDRIRALASRWTARVSAWPFSIRYRKP